ncbi:cytochrome P450 2U1-like [Ptychodera flava]|uniref:cytochrome P450 2U1-like n=1 Tax=Ptychodera flava TaxID=63121 RepID=UPI003969BEA7
MESARPLLDARTVLVAAVVFFISYWIFKRLFSKRINLPPGPPSLPLIGNLLAVGGRNPQHALRDMASKYGDVFVIRFGSQLVLILNSYEAVKEALVRNADDYVDRPVVPVKIGTRDHGVVFANGPQWKFKRRLMLSYLRSFGMGKSVMERRIMEECTYLLQEFEKHDGVAFDPAQTVSNAVSNVICSILVGNRFDYSDSRFINCLASLESMFGLGKFYFGLEFMNSGTGWLCDRIFGKENLRHNQAVYDVFGPIIEEHAETYDSDNMRDFIDVFLCATKDMEKESSETYDEKGLPFKYYYVYCLILDMFAAGTETTSTTLMWAWLLMMKYPNIQHKVQEELDHVVGKDRFPEMSDRPNLPYTEATITEVLRIASTVPLSVPRWTVNDTQLYGYDIPKDTMVWANIWSVLREPKFWSNPETFDPSRFLDASGTFSRSDVFIPFGIGPRICIGEQLAKMELFLVFTSVLQNYTLESDKKHPVPDLEGHVHLTLQPLTYHMRAVKR